MAKDTNILEAECLTVKVVQKLKAIFHDRSMVMPLIQKKLQEDWESTE